MDQASTCWGKLTNFIKLTYTSTLTNDRLMFTKNSCGKSIAEVLVKPKEYFAVSVIVCNDKDYAINLGDAQGNLMQKAVYNLTLPYLPRSATFRQLRKSDCKGLTFPLPSFHTICLFFHAPYVMSLLSLMTVRTTCSFSMGLLIAGKM